MSCYVEPDKETKQEFLNRAGEEVSLDYVIKNQSYLISKNSYPVCCIMHAPDILAIPILFNKKELSRLLRDHGTSNNNKYYVVPLEILREVSDIDNYL